MNDFKRGFFLELVFVGLVTVVAMVSTHILIPKLYSTIEKTPEYTSQKSQNETNAGEIKLIRPSSH